MSVVTRHRRTIRLREYDYRQGGGYFVTVCAHGGERWFCDVLDGEIVINDAGQMVEDSWYDLPERFSTVELDAFVVMPNHIHGIILINDGDGIVGAGLVPARGHPRGSSRAAGTGGGLTWTRPRSTPSTLRL